MKKLKFLIIICNEYYISQEDEVIFLKNIQSRTQAEIKVFNNKKIFIKSMIKLTDDKIVIFKSNKVVSNGEDRLIFFNYICKNEIEINIKNEYSFVLSVNGLTEMHNDNDKINNNIKDKKPNNKIKVILCACKKYINNQKNGILIICFDNDSINKDRNSQKSKYRFYDTGNFEVYCFCPLLLNINKNNILDDNVQKKMTNYFLAGGFDLKRKKGMIKLYKVNYGKNFNNSKIEYIQNLRLKDNNIKFKGPITSIIQTINDGKILINCWDGNVYLFEKPNIEKYLEYDQNIKNVLNKYI